MITVGIFGASGYSGIELSHLLERHPHVSLKFRTSDKLAGQDGFISHDDGLKQRTDLVFLATPPEASKELAPKLEARIVDLSNAFRPDDTAYALPPFFAPTNRIIANPGCYATAAIWALAPIASLISPEVIIDAASGTTGAGRRASEDYSFSELHDDLFAYRVLKHQHTPEIKRALDRVSGKTFDVTFTPKLLPVRRGILATAYARLLPGASIAGVFESQPVRVQPRAEDVRLRKVVGTNDVLLHADVLESRVVVNVAIDNLLKGAAGQAVENMNLAFGWPQATGLDGLRVHS